MKNIFLIIYPILLIGCTFFHAHAAPKGRLNPLFMDRGQTSVIQASACIAIIFHHVTQQITSFGIYNKGPVTLFNYMGFLFTGLFFFFSGFGLITSLDSKQDYLKSFLYRRLPAVLIPFWVTNTIGVILNITVYGAHRSLTQALCEIFGIILVNSNGWFIVEIVILYLLFFLFFRLVRNRDAALILLCAASLLMIAFSFFRGHDLPGNKVHWFRGEWWFNSTISFPAGLLFARFRKQITNFFRNHYRLLFVLFSLLTMITLQISIRFVNRYGYYPDATTRHALYRAWITLISQMTACIAFIVLIVLLQLKIKLGNPVMRYISKISRELFLIHGYFVNRVFSSVRMRDFSRYSAVLSCSILCAAALSPCINQLIHRVSLTLEKGCQLLSEYREKQKRIAQEAGAGRSLRQELRHSRRMKMLKRLFVAAVICVPGACIVIPILRDNAEKRQFQVEYAALQRAMPGSEVLWGHIKMDSSHPGTQQIPWIVIEKDSTEICLTTKYGIAGSSYFGKHAPVSWEDSDLRNMLNSEKFLSMFSKYEMEMIEKREHDYITLLTVDQVKQAFPSAPDRMLTVTEEAVRSGTYADPASHDQQWFRKGYCYSWWWLRQEHSQKSITAPIVDIDGSIIENRKAVNKPGGAIRPVIWVKLFFIQ